MEIRVLGPIEIRYEGRATRLTAPKECALLAALPTRPNEPVSTDRLTDALWPGDPPPSAGHNLRLYVAKLRRKLGDGDRVARLERGYALIAQPEEVDALRFEELLRAARAAGRADGTPADAVLVAAMYREALALWRGTAFEGVDLGGGPAQEYVARLDELRTAATEEWVDVELAQSDLGQSIAAYLSDVSSGGRRCMSYRDCAGLVRAGIDIDYDGPSGRIEFDSNGDVREGSFGIYQYDESNSYEWVVTRLVKNS